MNAYANPEEGRVHDEDEATSEEMVWHTKRAATRLGEEAADLALASGETKISYIDARLSVGFPPEPEFGSAPEFKRWRIAWLSFVDAFKVRANNTEGRGVRIIEGEGFEFVGVEDTPDLHVGAFVKEVRRASSKASFMLRDMNQADLSGEGQRKVVDGLVLVSTVRSVLAGPRKLRGGPAK